MSKFLSGEHLDTTDGLMVSVKVVKDHEEFLSTFFLSIPERDIEIQEFEALIDGLKEAKYKLEQLLEIFQSGLDE